MEAELTGRVKILNDSTLEILEEDHTFMNPLKMVVENNWNVETDEIDENKKVEFCGYSIPHPSDFLSQFTIQFENEESQTSKNVLMKVSEGCDVLEAICNKILEEISEK